MTATIIPKERMEAMRFAREALKASQEIRRIWEEAAAKSGIELLGELGTIPESAWENIELPPEIA